MHRFCQYHNCKGFVLSNDNQVTFIIRKHWIVGILTFLKWLFWGPSSAWILFYLFFFLEGTTSSDSFFLLVSLVILYLLGVSFYFFLKWLDDIFDILVLTNDRVIDVTQVDFWHRNIIETRLDYVQDATGDVKGVFQTLFDWGSIKIRTANDVADFSIDFILHPHQKAQEIFRLVNISKNKQNNAVNQKNIPENNTSNKGEINPLKFFKLHIKDPFRKKINFLMHTPKK